MAKKRTATQKAEEEAKRKRHGWNKKKERKVLNSKGEETAVWDRGYTIHRDEETGRLIPRARRNPSDKRRLLNKKELQKAIDERKKKIAEQLRRRNEQKMLEETAPQEAGEEAFGNALVRRLSKKIPQYQVKREKDKRLIIIKKRKDKKTDDNKKKKR